MSIANKVHFLRFIEEVWEKRNFCYIDKAVSDRFIGYLPNDWVLGPEGIKDFTFSLIEAFPDWQINIKEILTDNDKVVARWVAKGTHLGTFKGVAATGRSVIMQGIFMDRYENGTLMESWPHFDVLSLMQQIGGVPAEV